MTSFVKEFLLSEEASNFSSSCLNLMFCSSIFFLFSKVYFINVLTIFSNSFSILSVTLLMSFFFYDQTEAISCTMTFKTFALISPLYCPSFFILRKSCLSYFFMLIEHRLNFKIKCKVDIFTSIAIGFLSYQVMFLRSISFFNLLISLSLFSMSVWWSFYDS